MARRGKQSQKQFIEIGPEVGFVRKKIWLAGVISNKAQADEFIETINALKPMLDDEFNELVEEPSEA